MSAPSRWNLPAHFEANAVKRLGAIQCDPPHPLYKERQAHTSARSGRLIIFRPRQAGFTRLFFRCFSPHQRLNKVLLIGTVFLQMSLLDTVGLHELLVCWND